VGGAADSLYGQTVREAASGAAAAAVASTACMGKQSGTRRRRWRGGAGSGRGPRCSGLDVMRVQLCKHCE